MEPEAGLAGILGLAFRAGQLTPGAEMGLKLIRDGKAAMALLDPGASANTIKKVTDACHYRNVAVFTLRPGMLGRACGRAGMAAAAMKHGNLAQKAGKILTMGEPVGHEPMIAEDKG